MKFMRKDMKNKKRHTLFAACMALVLLVGSLAGCSTGGDGTGESIGTQTTPGGMSSEASGSSKGVKIVATIFPEYDWVRVILGENPGNAEVTMLLDNGVDLHSYQPTAADIMKISTCDLFIYVGGESDKWVEDALKEATNKDMVVINLLETLGDGVKAEEVVEGMEHEHDHEEETDEHVWLSLRNAAVLCEAIEGALEQIDSENAAVYQENLNTYKQQLSALDAEYREAVKNASVKTLLFGDRFPFRYLVDDYGLSYYAAFAGCSAETEASFETIIFLANKTDELGLPAIMKIESSDGRIAETVKSNTQAKDQKILTLDSLQSTASNNVADGASYVGIMTENLNVLKEALN